MFHDRCCRYAFSRADQDAFATESTQRALKAVNSGAFAAEITPVTVKGRKGETVVDRDETPFTVDLAKIRMVDLSAVAWAGRFVPAIYLTDGDVSSGVDFPFRDIVKKAHADFAAVHP